uniref:Uncharacterized protein n=1 Tax=Micrurus lemniscatus lemniscatus TaxID=129467 RepID=A0A2D4HXY3_MICLE
MLQYLNSQWQEFLENVATAPLLEEDAKDFQFPLGRVKEEPEENSEEARGELQSDPNISGKSLGGQGKAGFLGEGEDGRVSGDGWPGEPRTPTPQAVWPSGC